MTPFKGFLIPGLAMAAKEFPPFKDVHVFENPEIGSGQQLSNNYSLEDVAHLHVEQLQQLQVNDTPVFVGMSMGGMVLSIMATKYRKKLPQNARFVFLVSTPNLPDKPAIPDSLISQWATAKPGNVDDFRTILTPFFGPQYLQENSVRAEEYFAYRAFGKNGQSPKGFYRQMNALRSCNASLYFSQLNGQECEFIGGKSDFILGPEHSTRLHKLVPSASHREVEGMGHMVNLENPALFERIWEAPR